MPKRKVAKKHNGHAIDVAAVLGAYMRKRKMSQAELANLLEVTEGAVWQWMTGRTKITAERATDIEKRTKGEVPREKLNAVFGAA